MSKRVVTAVVLIAFLVSVLVWAPIWVFKAIVLLMIAGALREFYRIVGRRDYILMVTGMVFGLIFASMLIFYVYVDYLLPVLLGAFFMLVILQMIHYTNVEKTVVNLGLVLFGTVYLCFTLPFFAIMRDAEHGRTMIAFTVAIVAMGDTFAYTAGKLLGRHKLAPLISPKKTIEGFAASFFGGVAASLICWQLLWRELPVIIVIFLGAALAFIGALGDLVESMIKRAYHVKDSGTLLPGHGGVLDRVDAMVFAAPFLFLVLKFGGYL